MPNTSTAEQEKALKPIYDALEMHQYSKACKASYSKLCCDLPLAKALRAHALERNKRTLEALLVLRSILNSLSSSLFNKKKKDSKEQNGLDAKQLYWLELEEIIWCWKASGVKIESDEDLMKNNGIDITSVSEMTIHDSNHSRTTTTTTATSSKASTTSSGKGKKKKGGKKGTSSTASSSSTMNMAKSKPASLVEKNTLDLDLVDVLDLPKRRRKEIILNFLISMEPMRVRNESHDAYESILDETTLATIALTLRSLRLNETLVQLYTIATETLQSDMAASKTTPSGREAQMERERLCLAFIELYLCSLRSVTEYDYYELPSQDKTLSETKQGAPYNLQERIYGTRKVMEAYENAQLASMQLCKYSASKLHLSWCAHAALMHRKTCQEYIEYLQMEISADEMDDSSANKADILKKLSMKMSMLPRLAESLMFRVVGDYVTASTQAEKSAKDNSQRHKTPPNAEDWALYLETLEVQGKFEEGLDVLKCIQGANQANGEDEELNPIRKINDEIDVQRHNGSLIQISERDRQEKMVKFCKHMNKPEAARYIYANKLLHMMPDQWTYWLGLLETMLESHQLESEALEKCEEIQQNIQAKVQSSSTSRVPMRGPLLFKVEMAGFQVRKGDGTGSLPNLSKAIQIYADTFATLASCTFQDLRPYIDLLVQHSCHDGSMSDDVTILLQWAMELRKQNDPTTSTNAVNESDEEKKARRTKLRAYIFSIEMCFEIWYVLLSLNCEVSSAIDEQIAKYIPTADDMITLWENTLNLGSNPKDGGQKESLPGDNLILLSVQLIYHQSRHLGEDNQETIHTVVAAILERALSQSPYNAYLKIAALNCHRQNNSIKRAWEIFQDLEIKHVQLDSCSYFILPHLFGNAMFQEAIETSGKIINMHAASAKEIGDFMTKSFENGMISKGSEMIEWHRKSMRKSYQLMETKLYIMDLASLHQSDHSCSPLGAHHGLCGTNEDIERAQKLVRDSVNYFSPPSLMRLPQFESVCDLNETELSDNRDFTVNQFEILVRNHHSSTFPPYTVTIHSIMTHTVLLIQLTKAPKKGKLVKTEKGGSVEKRYRSLAIILQRADRFVERENEKNESLFEGLIRISQIVCNVIVGKTGEESTYMATLSERESACVVCLEKVLIRLSKVHDYLKSSDRMTSEGICNMLLTEILPFYIVLENAGNLFNIFGWGKRKRHTKAAAGAIAKVAEKFRDIIERVQEILKPNYAMNEEVNVGDVHDLVKLTEERLRDEAMNMSWYLKHSYGREMLVKVADNMISSHRYTQKNLESVLNHISNCLQEYSEKKIDQP